VINTALNKLPVSSLYEKYNLAKNNSLTGHEIWIEILIPVVSIEIQANVLPPHGKRKTSENSKQTHNNLNIPFSI